MAVQYVDTAAEIRQSEIRERRARNGRSGGQIGNRRAKPKAVRAALWPGTEGSRLSGLANRLAIEGIVAEQILLKFVKGANQQGPFPGRAILGEESLAALVGDRIDGSWRKRKRRPRRPCGRRTQSGCARLRRIAHRNSNRRGGGLPLPARKANGLHKAGRAGTGIFRGRGAWGASQFASRGCN